MNSVKLCLSWLCGPDYLLARPLHNWKIPVRILSRHAVPSLFYSWTDALTHFEFDSHFGKQFWYSLELLTPWCSIYDGWLMRACTWCCWHQCAIPGAHRWLTRDFHRWVASESLVPKTQMIFWTFDRNWPKKNLFKNYTNAMEVWKCVVTVLLVRL